MSKVSARRTSAPHAMSTTENSPRASNKLVRLPVIRRKYVEPRAPTRCRHADENEKAGERRE